MSRRSKFTLISSVRDEGPYILEWVAHHRVLGFDRICMASNDCTDGSDELLASMAAAGFIEHLHQSVSPEESPQVVAYAKMRDQLSIDDTEWLMVLDVDEFLNVHIGDYRVGDLTDHAGDECDIISLHAMCFTGHGQQQWEPGPICPRQQWRLPVSHRANRAMKSLTRHPERFVDIHNHSVTRLTNGDPAALLIMFGDGLRSHPQPGIPLWQQLRNRPMRPGEHRLAHYNHYCVKTWDSFNLRRLRGRGASTMGVSNDRHTDEYYKQRSVPDKKELCINRYAQAVAGEMAKMLAEPSVSRAQQRCETLYGAMCEPFRSPKLHSSPRATPSRPTNTGSFATVTTVAANKVSILSFVAHYLSLGAEELFLFVDGEKDPELGLHALPKQVKVFYCDEEYWHKQHRVPRPPDHRQRQGMNANLAVRLTKADFIAHVDIDEFIYSETDFREVLAALPNEYDGLRLWPAESIYPAIPGTYREAFSSLFKKRIFAEEDRSRVLKKVHGREIARFLEKGLQGYHVGKVVARRQEGLELKIHFHHRAGSMIRFAESDSALLLHYFCQGPADWLSKYMRRLERRDFSRFKPMRQSQWQSVVAAASRSDQDLWKLYLNLNVFSPARLRTLEEHGFLVRRNLDIPAKVEATLGLSQTFYDQSLPVFDAISASSALSEIGKKLKEQMNSSKEIPAAPKPKAPGPRRLHMDSQSIAPFEKKLENSRVYLEFGSGGSTVRACQLAVPEIHTVETSKEFLDGVIAECQAVGYSGTLRTHFIDIGPTKAWGYPVSRNSTKHWPAYCIAPWKSLEACGMSPDLILIDGRFRVAAFLYSLLMAKKGTTILFDDYEKRNHYHVVEQVIKPVKLLGRMAEFYKKNDPCIKRAIELLGAGFVDPR
jgi:hypothetical protein